MRSTKCARNRVSTLSISVRIIEDPKVMTRGEMYIRMFVKVMNIVARVKEQTSLLVNHTILVRSVVILSVPDTWSLS